MGNLELIVEGKDGQMEINFDSLLLLTNEKFVKEVQDLFLLDKGESWEHKVKFSVDVNEYRVRFYHYLMGNITLITFWIENSKIEINHLTTYDVEIMSQLGVLN